MAAKLARACLVCSTVWTTSCLGNCLLSDLELGDLFCDLWYLEPRGSVTVTHAAGRRYEADVGCDPYATDVCVSLKEIHLDQVDRLPLFLLPRQAGADLPSFQLDLKTGAPLTAPGEHALRLSSGRIYPAPPAEESSLTAPGWSFQGRLTVEQASSSSVTGALRMTIDGPGEHYVIESDAFSIRVVFYGCGGATHFDGPVPDAGLDSGPDAAPGLDTGVPRDVAPDSPDSGAPDLAADADASLDVTVDATVDTTVDLFGIGIPDL